MEARERKPAESKSPKALKIDSGEHSTMMKKKKIKAGHCFVKASKGNKERELIPMGQ